MYFRNYSFWKCHLGFFCQIFAKISKTTQKIHNNPLRSSSLANIFLIKQPWNETSYKLLFLLFLLKPILKVAFMLKSVEIRWSSKKNLACIERMFYWNTFCLSWICSNDLKFCLWDEWLSESVISNASLRHF